MNHRTSSRCCAIVGGGAAGFFAALHLKASCPGLEVTILERSSHVLAKVGLSGGGRCNCTNTFAGVTDLSAVYPRGHRLLRRLFHVFGPKDAYEWFESHGVKLATQPDNCVFPASQRSQTIIDCFISEAQRLGVIVKTGVKIQSMEQLQSYDYVIVTIGGQPHRQALQWLADMGHEIEMPVPSLFTFSIADEGLRSLAGTVCSDAVLQLPHTRFRSSGPLLVTHWGVSGPATLKLSSYAARWLSEQQYKASLVVNWLGMPETGVAELLATMVADHRLKQVSTIAPDGLSSRLWTHLLKRSLAAKSCVRWGELGKKDFNRLVAVLTADTYNIVGRAPFKDEFVTCGGVSLRSVVPQTLESRVCPGLFFAGEVLDIDGVTGGFNFQAAWTTAFVVAKAIAEKESQVNEKP